MTCFVKSQYRRSSRLRIIHPNVSNAKEPPAISQIGNRSKNKYRHKKSLLQLVLCAKGCMGSQKSVYLIYPS